MAQAQRKSTAEADQKRFGVSMSAEDEKALGGQDEGSTGGTSGAAAETGAATETASTGTGGAETGRTETGAGTGAAAPKTGADGTGTPETAKTVPLAALHEEREKRKELQKQIEALTQSRGEDSKSLERLRLIVEKMNLNPPQPAADPKAAQREVAAAAPKIVNVEENPVEALKMTAAEVKVLSDFKRQLEAGQAAALETQNVLDKTLELEQEFGQATPDYNAASTYLRNSRAAELQAHGLSRSRIQQILAEEAINMAAAALQRGENPAKVIYAAAKSRGYQRPAFLPQEAQALQKYGADKENEFKAATPDYDAAMDYLVKSRTAEYEAAGYPEAEARRLVERDRVSILVNAQRTGKNPAETAYAIAKSRGYAPKAATGTGNSGSEAERGAARSNEDGAEQLARMRRGQEAGQSLGGANGAARGKTGIDALLGMSDAEFAVALERMSPAQQRAHFGD